MKPAPRNFRLVVYQIFAQQKEKTTILTAFQIYIFNISEQLIEAREFSLKDLYESKETCKKERAYHCFVSLGGGFNPSFFVNYFSIILWNFWNQLAFG